jgi:hypothetical protein
MAYRKIRWRSGLVCLLALPAVACGPTVPISSTDAGFPTLPSRDAGGIGDGGIFVPDGAFVSDAPGTRTSCPDPAWACWPMPNPRSSALPNPARYDPFSVAVAMDAVTGLAWQRSPPLTTRSWSAAKAECAALMLDTSREDWRLPTRIELVSLVDFSSGNPAVDVTMFPGPGATFWTSSPASGGAGAPARAWQVSFDRDGATTSAGADVEARVRCVRNVFPTGQPRARYRIEGASPNEVVVDAGTGLEWQRATTDTTFSFDESRAQCAALQLQGGGWRVPSMKELQTLVHDGKTQAPFIDTEAFPGLAAGAAPFWTSSASATVPTAAWFVNFGTGEATFTASVTGDVKAQPGHVRCVR